MLKIFKRFYGFLLIRKYWFIFFLFLVILHVLLGFVTPYFYKLFVEKIQAEDYQSFVYLLIVYLAVEIFSNLVSNLRYIAGDVVTVDATIRARLAIFKYVQDLDFAFHTSKSTGSLISAFKRGDNAMWGLADRIHGQFAQVFIGFIVLVFYFASVDPRIIAIFLVTFLLTIVIARLLMPLNIKTRIAVNEAEDHISGIIADNMINYETVKLFSKEAWEQKRLTDFFKEFKRIVWRHFWTYRYIDLSLGSVVTLSVCAILFASMNLISAKQITLADFVLITTAITIFFPRLFDFVYGIRNLSQNYADLKKYFELLDYDVVVKDPDNEVVSAGVKGEISFNHLDFSYKEGKARAVKDINLKIKPGESVALVGRSGVGKTTLVRLLMRFFDVDSGEITIDGVNIKDFSKSRLRSFMGVVPQEPILFNNTIGYNISYGADNPSQEEIKAAAKMANLDRFIEGLPEKYATHVGERGIKLSGGQKQRLAIARMILSNPDIVIFDEATSQLDSESEKLIQEAFWRAVKNKTTIIIAHRLSTIQRADKIVVMEKGRIAEVGTHKELLSKDSLYKRFWSLQTS